jgi:hypothetical protein
MVGVQLQYGHQGHAPQHIGDAMMGPTYRMGVCERPFNCFIPLDSKSMGQDPGKSRSSNVLDNSRSTRISLGPYMSISRLGCLPPAGLRKHVKNSWGLAIKHASRGMSDGSSRTN